MNCCCTNTLDYCKQGICGGEIDFDVLAQIEGEHKLVLHYLDSQITLIEDLEVGDKIIFPIDELNENYQYTGELFDPNGAKILIRKNDIDYDCIKFKTVLNIAI